jgi:tRNA(fMet)-specific endonuclease VapC
MATMISLDSSVLIDFFRSKNKGKTLYRKLRDEGYEFAISAIAKYVVVIGVNEEHRADWVEEFKNIKFLDITDDIVWEAREVYFKLKRDNKLIEVRDIIIAATAITYEIQLATLNRKHFERIEGLNII